MKTCSIHHCEKFAHARGWCGKHYQRWKNNGDPLVARPLHNVNVYMSDKPHPNIGKTWSTEVRSKMGNGRRGKPSRYKGVPRPQEVRNKISLANRGQIPWNKGIPARPETIAKLRARTATEETRHKIREARKLQVLSPEMGIKVGNALRGIPKSPESVAKRSGPNHYRWKGGLRRNMGRTAWRKLRQQVLERDGFICQTCYRTGVTLIAHHVIPYPVGPDKIGNLISWCRRCHMLWHHSNAM